MADIDDLAARLATALGRLEELVQPVLESRVQARKDAAEIAQLKAEREGLLARIAELEADTQSLAGVAGEVEARLDDAIVEIRTALAR
jgi:cell division protein FtsB